jgi:hypothetical protein
MEVGDLESATARGSALSMSSGVIVDISSSEETVNDTDADSRVVADVHPSEN